MVSGAAVLSIGLIAKRCSLAFHTEQNLQADGQSSMETLLFPPSLPRHCYGLAMHPGVSMQLGLALFSEFCCWEGPSRDGKDCNGAGRAWCCASVPPVAELLLEGSESGR